MKALKIITDILCVLMLLVGAWALVSWAEIVCHNSMTDPIYSAWNLFALLF